MGCGCGKTNVWTPPTEEELAAAAEAKAARAEARQQRALLAAGASGPQGQGYRWNGPTAAPAASQNAPV